MNLIVEIMPSLMRGLMLTVVLSLVCGVAGTLIGGLVGTGAVSPIAPIRWLANGYTNVIRGLPPLVILFFMYYGLPAVSRSLTFSALMTGAIGLTVFASAYVAEIIRGSIRAVPLGQTEASLALNLGYVARMTNVVLPQALRIAIAPWTTFMITLIKISSLTSVIGLVDLTKAGKISSNVTYEPLIIFLVVGLLYFIISYPIALVGRRMERVFSLSV